MKKIRETFFKWDSVVKDGKCVPKSFPGRFPTRWRIVFKYQEGKRKRVWRYFGKPDRRIADKLNRMCNKLKGTAWTMEGDKNGVIQQGYCRTPSPYVPMAMYSNVARFYYPWNLYDNMVISNWGGQGFGRMQITFKGKKWVVYSRVQRAADDTLGAHKKWLEKSFPWQ